MSVLCGDLGITWKHRKPNVDIGKKLSIDFDSVKVRREECCIRTTNLSELFYTKTLAVYKTKKTKEDMAGQRLWRLNSSGLVLARCRRTWHWQVFLEICVAQHKLHHYRQSALTKEKRTGIHCEQRPYKGLQNHFTVQCQVLLHLARTSPDEFSLHRVDSGLAH